MKSYYFHLSYFPTIIRNISIASYPSKPMPWASRFDSVMECVIKDVIPMFGKLITQLIIFA